VNDLKVKILSKKGIRLDFVLEETDPAFANSLRRIMNTEIPTLSVEWIDVHENISALFDEIISHRLGMVPLKFDPDKFNMPDDCKCGGKGCPLCQVAFVLDKQGPCLVTSGDLKSSDKGVAPTDPRIPIVRLLEGHSLKLEAVAKLGLGINHAKHQAAIASYQYYPELKVTGGPSDVKKAIKACPKGTISLKGNKAVLAEPEKCDLCRSCMVGIDGVEIKGDENKILFRVESVSGLEPAYIVTRAAEILKARAEEFKKKLEKI
jgi:DNA-directed RNA polymerase subunit D